MESKKYNFEKAVAAFFMDCSEMLDEMEQSLLELEKDFTDNETINALFRSIHTIKGSSGMFGFETIEKFTHLVESLLDDVRRGVKSIDSDLIALLLESHDFIEKLVKLFEVEKDAILDEGMIKTRESLIQRLNLYIQPDNDDKSLKTDKASIEKVSTDNESTVYNECWHISLRFGEEVFIHRLDPVSFIEYLGGMGDIVHIIMIPDRIPPMEEIDPEKCYLGLEIDFMGETDKEELENVFDFLMDDCSICILPPKSKISDYVELIQDIPETPQRIGEILTRIGTLTKFELEEALALQGEQDNLENQDLIKCDRKKLGEIVVEEKMVQEPVINAAVEKQETIIRNRRSIRIDPDKLDKLINHIGELVIIGANVKQFSEKIGDMELNESVVIMSKLIEEVRDSAMNIRMVQIGELFKKYERVVRDLSRDRGKEIKLNISGGDTELDKVLIDKLGDPLMHLVRNSIDHGIDTPEERTAMGKPSKGTISLNAYHGTGNITIECTDDGNGLNRERIYQKAVEKKLISSNQEISDNELFQFIFEPAFSTAETVSSISGRGVGMDVVNKNIQSIRGTIELESKEGVGTSFRIHLPLTLAIIDGFMVEIGGARYIIPLDMVVECTEVSIEDIKGNEAYNFIDFRGEVLPFLRLRDFFDHKGEESIRENIIIVEYAQKKVGFVVDKLVGEFQTVIKPLGKLFMNLKWTIGATILGSGEVALILDVPTLIRYIQSIDSTRIEKVQETVNATELSGAE